MTFGVRSKLFAVSFAVVVLVVLASGVYLESLLRKRFLAQTSVELENQARAARVIVEISGGDMDIPSLDALADRLGEAARVRVTIIASGGAVLGDSTVDRAAVATMEHHGRRPEVLQAGATGVGRAQRYSTTRQMNMMYVAVPFTSPRGSGFVRVAMPLSEIERFLGQLRRRLLLAGILGLFVAVLMSALASHLMSRTLRRLISSARRIASGDPRRVSVSSHDELGRLAGSLNQMADEIGRTVAELTSERERLRAVLAGMNDALVAVDEHRAVTLMNPSALALLGLAEVPEGKPFIDYLRAPALVELLAQSGPTSSAEFDMPGSATRILARLTRQETGRCVVVMHDVTAVRRLERIRRDFVANVSHELRTPVSVVRANAETLIDGAMSDPKHGPRLLEAIERNADRLSRIINDLLDLSRLDAGAYDLAPADVALLGAVERAVVTIESKASARQMTVELNVGATLMVRADPAALDLVLVNLLDNAVKYADEAGIIEVRAETQDNRVRFAVIDDGPGIAEHHRARLFERFYRVDAGRSRHMGGTGLGLAIVKHLVETMGGTIGVDPAEPHGSCFWVELPAGR